MKKLILLSLVLLAVLVAPFSLLAQPRLINYQGNILDQMDKPFQGPVQMTFELYDKEFGGTQLWSEIQNVSLNNGYFNVYLGSVTPFAPDFKFNRELWVQVTVGNGAPFKRTPLTMVPASFVADYSKTSGFAQDIPDKSVTLAKLADEVKTMGGDLTGELPNPRLRPGAALANIENGSITQEKLSPNVTTRPSGPASGDLTGFYPDPLIAPQAVKTDRIADFAVTTDKLALGAVTYNRLQPAVGPIGTILGWDGTKWIETDVPTWEIGRVKNITAGDGTYTSTITDSKGFLDISVGIADSGVTTPKIANKAVTYNKLQDATGPVGTILGWDGTKWIETDVPTWEKDAVIGNEVVNATPGRGLVRAGLGTFDDPYTLGIANNGVITEMIANKAVTLTKLADGNRNGQVMWWDSVTNQWQLTVGTAQDNYVVRWFDNGTTRELRWSADDAIIGNEITDVTTGRGLVRAGAGTTASPYTVGIADNGVVTSMIADANVTFRKLENGTAIGNILAWNGTQWAETTVPTLEADGIIGNEVLDATPGRGLVRSGAGTASNPWTLGIADNGVQTSMIQNQAVTYTKLQNAVGGDGTIIGWFGGAWVETDVPTWELGRVEAVTAGEGIEVVNTTDAQGFITSNVSIADNGVTSDKIADSAVTLDKLAPGVQVGQVMYYDNVSNSWLLSSTVAPTQDQVIKWVDNGLGSFIPQWANDDITLPFYRVENELTSLFTLINDADAPAMQLVGRTQISTGLYGNSAFDVFNDAGGRGATVIGGSSNDQNSGLPYLTNDITFDDDAALVVANYSHLNGAVYPAYTTAIRAFGDIWTNARVGGEEGIFNILNVDTLNVIDLFAVNAYIDNLFATNGDIDNLTSINITTDNLQVNLNAYFAQDVTIDGNLDVAQDVFLNTDGGFYTTYVNQLDVTNDAVVGNDFAVGNNAFVGNNLNVAANTETFTLNVVNSAQVGLDLGVGNDVKIGNNLLVLNNTTTNSLNVVTNAVVNGNTQTTTLNVTANAVVNGNTQTGTLNVLANATVGNNLNVSNNATINGNLTANRRIIMQMTGAPDLTSLNTGITNGLSLFNYQTSNPAEANLVGALNAGVTGQVIYIINNTSVGPITVGTLLNPVTIQQNQMVALIYDGTNWIPMAN